MLKMRRISLHCARCNKPFERLECQMARGRGRYCSRACAAGAAARQRWQERRATVSIWFWDWVDRSAGETGCWPWTGCTSKSGGYGRYIINGKGHLAHRTALHLTSGPPPAPRMFACHTCDNPPCCNPAHLWWGTNAENIADARKKGRMTNNKMPAVDADIALIMHEAGLSYAAIGREMGFHQTSIKRAIVRAKIAEQAAAPKLEEQG